MTTVSAFWTSLVRTVTPIVVAAVATFLANIGIPVDDEFRAAIDGLVGVAAGALWYAIVRLVEIFIAPKFGWLLGIAKAPEYEAKHAKTES